MKRFILCLFFCLAYLYSGATGQMHDKITIEGESWDMFTSPLSLLDTKTAEAFKILVGNRTAISSANWRGYVAYWHIGKKGLFLDKVEVIRPGGKHQIVEAKALRKALRKYSCLGRIKARWLTGNIRIGKGAADPSPSAPHVLNHAEKRILVLKNGKVMMTAEM